MKLRMVLALALGLVFAGGALAEDKGLDNHAKRDPYYEKLKGKKVIFVPLAMGFDLTEGWAAIMRRQAKDLGYSFEIRDPELEHRRRHPRHHRSDRAEARPPDRAQP